jgi:hypothetical protein
VRTITNAGAACHIDKWVNFNPEETTQLPVHIERSSLIENSDSFDREKQDVQTHSSFSEEMRQEILEMEQGRKKSDAVITVLFAFLFLFLLGAVFYLSML